MHVPHLVEILKSCSNRLEAQLDVDLVSTDDELIQRAIVLLKNEARHTCLRERQMDLALSVIKYQLVIYLDTQEMHYIRVRFRHQSVTDTCLVFNDDAGIQPTSTRWILCSSNKVEDLCSLDSNSPLVFRTPLVVECELSLVVGKHCCQVNVVDLPLVWASLLIAHNAKLGVLVTEGGDCAAAFQLVDAPVYDLHAWNDRRFGRAESKTTDKLLKHTEAVGDINEVELSVRCE